MSGRRTREVGWPADPAPLPAPVVDNHTHLDSVVAFAVAVPDDAPPRTLDDHLARAAAVGVTRLIQIGCDLDAADWTDALVRASAPTSPGAPGAPAEPPALAGSAGSAEPPPALAPPARAAVLGGVAIHPNEAVLHAGVREVAPDGLEPDPVDRHATGLDAAIARIADLARDNERIRVIGETGLDHFRAGPRGRAVQVEAFRAHIALAKELGLVLQIHDRDAHAEVLDVLERDGAPERTVFHCFSGDAAMARWCAARGWYLSFAGPVTFSANSELRDAVRDVPLSQVLVETDAPYLTPHPLRGRPNAPYLLPHTVRRIAEVRGYGAEDVDGLTRVCDTLTATSLDVYGPW